eukprot:jgi/Galph1/1179/GphlegSOOS_G5927.1
MALLWDAVVIPGGGLDANGNPHHWVQERLKKAVSLSNSTRYFIALSKGTPHKSPILDEFGFPMEEATASARFLVEKGNISPERILKDCWSLDTLGNAYFTRFMICEPLRLSRLCVITNDFHLPRTKYAFETVFGLSNVNCSMYWDLKFVSVDNFGLEESQLKSRREKEAASLQSLKELFSSLQDVQDLTRYIFTQHKAYAEVGRANGHNIKVDSILASTY